MPIVNNKRSTTRLLHARRKLLRERNTISTDLDDALIFSLQKPALKHRRRRRGARGHNISKMQPRGLILLPQLVPAHNVDKLLAPRPLIRAPKYMDGQGVEKLLRKVYGRRVGAAAERSVGDVGEGGVPAEGDAVGAGDRLDGLFLDVAQGRAGLDEVDGGREAFEGGEGAEDVCHERAVAGPELGEGEARAGELPRDRRDPDRERLAEDLRHFRGGDEVARRAEDGAPGRVVAVGRVGEAEARVLRDGYRAREEDLAAEEGAEGGERLLGSGGGGCGVDWLGGRGGGERAVKRMRAEGAAEMMAGAADHFERGQGAGSWRVGDGEESSRC